MNLIEMKGTLEPENIKMILEKYDIHVHSEETNYMVFPTFCHNIDGGSPKLYYYYDSKLFVCYTECNDSFDIYTLIQMLEEQRGNKVTIFQAAELIGLGSASSRRQTIEEIISAENTKFIEQKLIREVAPRVEYEVLEKELIDNVPYNEKYLKPWIDEGISEESLKRFQIGYSFKDLAIAIPHRDSKGNIVGLRGRFMEENAPNKYMPLAINGVRLSHSLRGCLYGLYENKANIAEKRRVVLYEGEKSVLLHDTIFGSENNISVATCGNRISNEQINLLIESGVQEVILAFDQDFKEPYERDDLATTYTDLGERLKQYFSVSIIIDWEDLLNYKDSPIDGGRDIFNRLYANRFYI